MKNSYLDYKVFAVSDVGEINEMITGENQKRILIVVLTENNPEMNAFLEKILSAIKIQLQTDCLILRGDNATDFPSFSNILRTFPIEKTIVFGFKPADLGLSFETPQYFITEIKEFKFLFVDALSVIFNTIDRKKALWDCLQILFTQ